MGAWPNPLQQVAEAGFVIAKAAGPRALMPPCAGNECWWHAQQDLLDFTSQLFPTPNQKKWSEPQEMTRSSSVC
jgi:hypothetical protein